MPRYSHVLLEKDPAEHLAWLTINRPRQSNAMDHVTIGELCDAIQGDTAAIRESGNPIYEGR